MNVRGNPLTLLLAVYLLLVCATVIWWAADTRPPLIDPARHLNISLSYYRYITDAPLKGLATAWFLPYYYYYPPFVYCCTALLYAAFGTSLAVARAAMLLFLLLSVLATYGIGRRLAGEWAGVFAGILYLCYPFVLETGKVYMLEIPLTAMVATSIYLLIRTSDFQKRAVSCLLGVVLGLGSLTKWHFVVFVIGPITLCVLRALSGARSMSAASRRNRLENIAATLLLALAVSAPWYLLHAGRFGEAAGRFGFSTEGTYHAPPLGSFDSFRYYPYAFVDQLMHLPLAIVFAAGLANLTARRRFNLLLLTGVIAPICLLSFVVNKQARHLLPVLPSCAVLSAMGVLMIRTVPLRRGAMTLALLVSAFNILAIDFGFPLRSYRLAIPLPGQSLSYPRHHQECVIYQAGIPQTLCGPPRREDWKIDEIVRVVRDCDGDRERAIRLGMVIAPRPHFSQSQFYYAIRKEGYRIKAVNLLYGLEGDDWGVDPALLRHCDMLLVSPFPGMPPVGEILASRLPSSFRLSLIKTYHLPDGSAAYLYRCGSL